MSRTKAKRAPLNAFAYQLDSHVSQMHENMRNHDPLVLTYDELHEMLVPEQYRSALIEAGRIREGGYRETTHYSVSWRGRCDVDFLMNGPLPPVVLRKELRNTDVAQSEVADRVDEWVTRRLQLAVAFARTRWLLTQLDETCNTPAQVRYYWPTILTLCSVGTYKEALAPLVGKLQEPYGRAAPPLSMATRRACQLAAGTVTGASLLAKAPDVTAEVTAALIVTYNSKVHDAELSQAYPMK